MTVNLTDQKFDYAGDGATTAFSFPRLFLENDDLKVILRTDATGAEAVQTIVTHYTVTGAENPGGGTVTMVTPPASGETLFIVRRTDEEQNTDYPSSPTYETALDKLHLIVQDIQEKISRALKLTETTDTAELTLPEPEADKVLGWNAGGTALENQDAAVGGGLDNVVEDTTPQLGGNLDTQSFTVDGRDVSTDGTKLDGIETGATADQTDAEIETAYNNQVSTVSQAEAEAGTATTIRTWTAQRVAQAIAALGGGSGDVTSASNITDNSVVRGDGGAKGVQESKMTVDDDGNMTLYEAVNDGNPDISLGSSSAQRLRIQAIYDGGAQTLLQVRYQTQTTSVDANAGQHVFFVDGSSIAAIEPQGVSLTTGLSYQINQTDVLTATTLGSGVVNSSLTNVGTLTALTSTGVVDFGGATSVEIPNGTTPTVNAAGEIAVDTSITDHTGLITYHDGTEAHYVVAMPTSNLTAVDGQVVTYNATNNEFELSTPAGGGNVSNSGTPANDQLALWVNSTSIEGIANLTYNGTALNVPANITLTGTVDGRDIATDGTKLDGIDAGADVTDETSVVAALSGATLTDMGVPASTDKVLIQDTSDSDNLKYADFSDFGGGLSNVVEDTTPQLGGNLDTQTFTVDGRDVGTDGTKLDGIEAGADVTDTTNVTAAGALMDSEVDADIKTLVLPANTTISTFGATLVDDADAATARTTLGVDAAGTDNAPAGSTTVAGKLELAVTSEIDAGTDTARAMGVDEFAASRFATKEVSILVFDDSEDVATGNGANDVFWRVPSTIGGMNLVAVAASHQTAGTGTGVQTTDIQIHNVTQAADMLSTVITVDEDETDSSTAATAAVIDAANDDVATGDQIRIDVDAVTGTTAPKGLLVELQFRMP